jgi:hypothetical protein
MMISVKAFCAVPINCGVDLQWNWHTFLLQITTILLQYKNYSSLPRLSHSVVCMRLSLQGLPWFECCEIGKEELLI